MTDEFLQAASGLADFFAGLPDDHVMLELSDILAELEAGLAEKLAVAKDDVIPQYHRAGLKKCEAIEATTHTTKTPIATRPTCLDIRSILACKTSASTEALSPSMPAPVRQDLEARILAGESIGGPDYRPRPRPA